jgi:hypothetical protein
MDERTTGRRQQTNLDEWPIAECRPRIEVVVADPIQTLITQHCGRGDQLEIEIAGNTPPSATTGSASFLKIHRNNRRLAFFSSWRVMANQRILHPRCDPDTRLCSGVR